MTIVNDFIATETAKLAKRIATPTAEGYGVDLVCIDDLDPHLNETDPNDFNALTQDAYHRLSTARGQLPDDPNYGIDLVAYLNVGHTPRDLAAISGQVVAELRKDDRFLDVNCFVTAPDPQSLNVEVRITPADPDLQTFTLILAVTDGAVLLQEVRSSL